jgi:hypothetical protein
MRFTDKRHIRQDYGTHHAAGRSDQYLIAAVTDRGLTVIMLMHTIHSTSMATQRQAALPATAAAAMAGCPLHLHSAPARALLHRQPLTAGRRQQISRGQRTVVAASAAAAAPAAQKIRIKLSSFNVPLLTESVDLIKTAAFETGACCSSLLGRMACEIAVLLTVGGCACMLLTCDSMQTDSHAAVAGVVAVYSSMSRHGCSLCAPLLHWCFHHS